MLNARRTLEEPLDEVWPPFLDALNTSSAHVWLKLQACLERILETRPPRYYRGLPIEVADEIKQEVLRQCCDDNFRTLRQYKNRGRPFSGWLRIVVQNTIIDFFRQDGRFTPRPDPPIVRRDDEVMVFRETLEVVIDSIEALPPEDKAILRLTGDGLKPAEIAAALKLPRAENKRIGTRLHHLRVKLRRRLRSVGLDIEDTLR